MRTAILVFYIVETIRLFAWIGYLSWLRTNYPGALYGGELLLMQHMAGSVLAFPYNFSLLIFQALDSPSFFVMALTYFFLWAMFTIAGVCATRWYLKKDVTRV